jgi:hypothetical protein
MIEGSQHGSLTFPLEGRKLNAESGILHRNALLTAHQESDESKDS